MFLTWKSSLFKPFKPFIYIIYETISVKSYKVKFMWLENLNQSNPNLIRSVQVN